MSGAADHIPAGAALLENLVIEHIPRGEWAAATSTPRGVDVASGAVKIVVRGQDGTVIAGVWPRDQALAYFFHAAKLLRDG